MIILKYIKAYFSVLLHDYNLPKTLGIGLAFLLFFGAMPYLMQTPPETNYWLSLIKGFTIGVLDVGAVAGAIVAMSTISESIEAHLLRIAEREAGTTWFDAHVEEMQRARLSELEQRLEQARELQQQEIGRADLDRIFLAGRRVGTGGLVNALTDTIDQNETPDEVVDETDYNDWAEEASADIPEPPPRHIFLRNTSPLTMDDLVEASADIYDPEPSRGPDDDPF